MMNPQTRPWSRNPRRIRAISAALLIVTAAACLMASAVHFGLGFSIGPLAVGEPRLVPAAIVEGLIGLALTFALAGVLTWRQRARQAAIGAYIFGVAGFLFGVSIVLRDPGIQTPFNVGVHVGVLPLLVIGLALSILSPDAAWRGDPARPPGRRGDPTRPDAA